MSMEERVGILEGNVELLAGEFRNAATEQVQATREVSQKLDANFKLLVEALTGKDQMPTMVVALVVKTMGWVIFGCIIVIVFLLTGIKFGFIPSVHG